MKTLIYYISVILIWGSTWMAIRLQLGIVDPMITIIYRFTGASFIIFIYCLLSRRSLKFSLNTHIYMFLQGICTFALNYWLFYVAQQVITSGLAAVLFSLLVFMNLMNATLFLKAQVKRSVLSGAFLGLVGIAFLFQPEFHRIAFTGKTWLMIGFGLVATYIFSIGNIISARNQKKGLPLVQSTAFSMLYGVLFLSTLAWIRGKSFTIDFSVHYLGALLYTIIFGSVIAFLFYLTLIGTLGAGRTGYIMLLTPLVAMTLSTVFEGYQWSPLAMAGMVLVLAGNFVAIIKKKPKSI